jgi:hypothetical protein
MRPPLLTTLIAAAYGDPIVYHVRNVLDGVEPIWVRSQQDDAAQALFTAVAKNNLLRRPPIEEGQTSAWYFFKETDKSFSRLLGRLTVGANGVQNQTRVAACGTRDARRSEACAGFLTEDALSARETQFQASAASLDADDAFSRLLLGCALADAGDLPSSIRELETAKKLAGRDANIAEALARVVVAARVLEGGDGTAINAVRKMGVGDVDAAITTGAALARAHAGRHLRDECAKSDPDVALVAKMLAAGADAGERDAHGRTAVMLAASEKHAHLVETLCAYSMPFPEDAAHAALASEHDADVVRALERACGYVIQKPPREAVGKQVLRFVKRWGRALKRRITGTLDADVSIGSLLWALLAVGVAVLAVDRSWFGRAKVPAPRADEEPLRRRPSTESATSLQTHADAPTSRRESPPPPGLEAPRPPPHESPQGRERRGRESPRSTTAPPPEPRLSVGARARLRRERERAAAEAVAVVETVSDPPTPEREQGDLAALQALDARRLSPAALDASMELLPDLLRRCAIERARRAAAEDAGTECVVCLEDARSVAFGCGHLCVCEACAPTVVACPLCREPVRAKQRIYFD